MVAREDVRFRSGTDQISAWLYRPDGTEPAPLLIMGHGLGAVREMRLDAYAEKFAAAGYACLVFDYRNFGASGGEPRQVLDVARQLADWSAAVDYAQTLPGVDRHRIGLWGTSFGGGHVIASAARLPGIAAVVAQCPFTDGLASARTIPLRVLPRLGFRAVRDLLAARLGRPPVPVALAGRPGAVALMSTADAYDGYQALKPAGADIPGEVAARIGLLILAYRPGRLAARIDCPVLFCVCDADSVAPPAPTLRYAARAPRGQIKRYPQGHFDIYLGAAFEGAVADQIAFLDAHLKPAGRPAAG